MAAAERENAEIFPSDFVSWHHCITVKCRVPLSESYVAERVATLSDPNNEETRRFIKLYGEAWHQQVLGWFRQAAAAR